LKSSARFLDEHLAKWIGLYSGAAAGIKGCYDMYPEAIAVLEVFIDADRRGLDEVEEAYPKRWVTSEEATLS